MKLPIRCYSCNRDIGKLEYAYNEYVKLEMSKIKSDTIHGISLSQNKMEKIFETLNIPVENYCCRKMLSTVYPFWDAYVGYNIDEVQEELPVFLAKEKKSSTKKK